MVWDEKIEHDGKFGELQEVLQFGAVNQSQDNQYNYLYKYVATTGSVVLLISSQSSPSFNRLG